MPDITSYLTAAGAYQTGDLVLKLAPTRAFFFSFSTVVFSFFLGGGSIKKKKQKSRCFVHFAGSSCTSGQHPGHIGVRGRPQSAVLMVFLFFPFFRRAAGLHDMRCSGVDVLFARSKRRGDDFKRPRKESSRQRETLLPDEYLARRFWQCEIQGGKSDSSHQSVFAEKMT